MKVPRRSRDSLGGLASPGTTGASEVRGKRAGGLEDENAEYSAVSNVPRCEIM